MDGGVAGDRADAFVHNRRQGYRKTPRRNTFYENIINRDAAIWNGAGTRLVKANAKLSVVRQTISRDGLIQWHEDFRIIAPQTAESGCFIPRVAIHADSDAVEVSAIKKRRARRTIRGILKFLGPQPQDDI